MSDWQPDFDRLAIDLHVRDEPDSSAEIVRVYVDTSELVGETGRSRALASLELAKLWFSEPEGVAFEYSLVDRIREEIVGTSGRLDH